jgi:hypothetical protein
MRGELQKNRLGQRRINIDVEILFTLILDPSTGEMDLGSASYSHQKHYISGAELWVGI